MATMPPPASQESAHPRGSLCEKSKDLVLHGLALLIMSVVWVMSTLTWPLSYLLQKPWLAEERAERVRATRENLADPHSAYYRIGKDLFRPFYLEPVRTIPELQKMGIGFLNGHGRSLGQREVLEVRSIYCDKTKKNLRKFVMTDYKWLTLTEVDDTITTLEKAFRAIGVKEGQRVLIYAETRLEWFLCAHAVFRIGAAIATLYSTLGEEGLKHGLEETACSVLITSEDLLGKLRKPLPPTVESVVYFSTLADGSEPKLLEVVSRKSSKTRFMSYRQLMEQGETSNLPREQLYDVATSHISEDMPAVILYTSGSTGKPKGVILTHRNIISTIKAVYTIVLDEHIFARRTLHSWYGYLPLAHVLEFVAENVMYSCGVSIGYGSPFTMTDMSTGIIKGHPGDLTLLQPTIVPGVPLVLERIRKTIQERVQARTCSGLISHMLRYLVEYKQFWTDACFSTPIFDMIVSARFRKLLGGRIEMMLIGGAPLSADTQKMMGALLNVSIRVGYGSTETCGGNLVQDFDDHTIGWTGAPLYGIKVRLLDWAEGGYTTADQPNPRGELHVGGDSVSAGYFAQKEQTAEAFYQENGVQWFRTGDIVEMNKYGMLRIVDRKKDLVKLQNGEYVSLGKIETELKNCLLVENVCVYGDSTHSGVVALLMPNPTEAKKLALQWVNTRPPSSPRHRTLDMGTERLQALYDEPGFVAQVHSRIVQFCARETKLRGVEVPAAVHVCREEWSTNNDLLTAAMKIKRVNLVRHYRAQIEQMYAALPAN